MTGKDAETMETPSMTLCAPDEEKSCFACCPPIRPPGYEHINFANEIKRVLRENTASIRREDRSILPITGYSCWGLGYLDGRCKRIGCLLHPAQNHGQDLRYRVNFGDKCARESCVEAKIFLRLSRQSRIFWLRLSEGLDSFSYSSRIRNPLFRILGWGDQVLNEIAMAEKGREHHRSSILKTYSFFETPLSPRANAYLLRVLTRSGYLNRMKKPGFRNKFEDLSARLASQISDTLRSAPTDPYVHLLPLESDFLDFVRLAGHIVKAGEAQTVALKKDIDCELAGFRT